LLSFSLKRKTSLNDVNSNHTRLWGNPIQLTSLPNYIFQRNETVTENITSVWLPWKASPLAGNTLKSNLSGASWKATLSVKVIFLHYSRLSPNHKNKGPNPPPPPLAFWPLKSISGYFAQIFVPISKNVFCPTPALQSCAI
jgi:hypothetical protein